MPGSVPSTRGAEHACESETRRCEAMDEATVRRLYQKYGRLLFTCAMQYTLDNHHDAEELVQAALLRAWRHPEIVADPEGNPLPWLRRVVRNLAIDRLRAHSCRPQTTSDEVLQEVAAPRDAFDDLLTAQVVREALDGLSTIHRAVLAEMY